MGFIHVVAAVIVNDRNEVLIARRPLNKHQGGLWEFPGGKLESGESPELALARELLEELGIDGLKARPLLRVRHHYPDKSVLLDVWKVTAFDGQAYGREGQPVEWLPTSALTHRKFPAANGSIITAAQLPDRYLITPEPTDWPLFLAQLERALVGGVRLVQLRAKSLSESAYLVLAEQVLACCRRYGAKLMLNAAPEHVIALGADGVHLSSQRLCYLTARPLAAAYRVAASCHNAAELAQAGKIGVDFAVLGSVLATPSHPGVRPLGWVKTQALIDEVAFPVYALGGMALAELDQAYRCGAQGIAAIRALWR